MGIINVVKAAIVECGPGYLNAPDCGANEFFGLLHNLMKYAVYFTVIIVSLAAIYAGFRILTSEGSPEKIKEGYSALTAAVIGVVIIFSAWIIVNLIIAFLLPGCRGWNIVGGIKCS